MAVFFSSSRIAKFMAKTNFYILHMLLLSICYYYFWKIYDRILGTKISLVFYVPKPVAIELQIERF